MKPTTKDDETLAAEILYTAEPESKAEAFMLIDSLLDAWEDEDGKNSILGFKERVWKKYEGLKETHK